MLQDVRKHVFAYIFLLIIVGAFVATFVYAWPNRTMERFTILGFCVAYFFWGTITHLKTNKITRFVIEEYLAVATLGGLILLLLTF